MGLWDVNTPPGHKKKKREGPFKMMATPTLRRFKMIWGPTPQAHILINACSLYCIHQSEVVLPSVSQHWAPYHLHIVL